MLASASATPMRIRGTLIDSTIFHTSDQLMESIVDVLFQFRNPASQSQISSLTFPVYVSIDAGRRRPEGSWEPPPPIQPHGRPCAVGPRAFCRIVRTICRGMGVLLSDTFTVCYFFTRDHRVASSMLFAPLLARPLASAQSATRAVSEGHMPRGLQHKVPHSPFPYIPNLPTSRLGLCASR